MTHPRYRRYGLMLCLTSAITYGILSLLIGTDASSGRLGWRVSIAPRRDVEQVRDRLRRGQVDIAFDAFGYREPYRFWHDDGKIATQVRSADVVFLGSSRSQFAYDQSLLLAEFQRRHLNVYNLGFGCNENIGFGVKLLERYRAKPSILIINLDLNIFRRKFSRCTRDVVEGRGAIAFQRQRWAHALQFSVLTSLDRLISRVAPREFDNYLLPNYLLVRSNETGFWVTDIFETRAQAKNAAPIVMADDPECRRSLDAEERQNIDYWRDQLAQINPNARILFTYIPHDRFCPDRLAAIANHFNDPGFQFSDPTRLETFDTSHLTRESAHDYTTEFMDWLERLYPALTRR
jgi:hypothetical protein